MKKLIFGSLAALCVSLLSGQADAMCAGGNSARSCTPTFGNSAAEQPDASATTQGFDAQNGSQWARSNAKFGNFTFYSGTSAGNSWTDRQSSFGNRFGNARGLDAQGRPDPSTCVLYGTCR
jgi:hypothetical protein